jgi:hypothetical protein
VNLELFKLEAYLMKGKKYLARTAMAAALVIGLGGGCAPASGYKNPEVEATDQRTRGTVDELSPLAPAGASNVKRVGNQWTCMQNGRMMIYDDAASCWKPK